MKPSLDYAILRLVNQGSFLYTKGVKPMKRTDNKGRLLKNGESQRKDGRYAYKYIENGKEKFIYSWKLVATDRVPKGKRDCIALRDKIKAVQKDLYEGINTSNRNITVLQLYERYTKSRANIRKSTTLGRKTLVKMLENDRLGNMCIDKVKVSEAKAWAYRTREKYAYSTIKNMKRSLNATFYLAIQDDLLRKNPFDFSLTDVIENDTQAKKPLTEEQITSLLEFTKNDCVYQRYYYAIIVLLHTGLRISELCGLTLSDIDFNNNSLNIDKQLKKDKDSYYIEKPKTESGVRQLPMNDYVIKVLQEVIESRTNAQEIEVDGYRDFIFLTQQGVPMYSQCYSTSFRGLAKKYNKYTGEEIKLTPHILRHTYCTNMANMGMQPNALQYAMGHKNITMTLGYYAHGSFQSVQAEMQRLFVA